MDRPHCKELLSGLCLLFVCIYNFLYSALGALYISILRVVLIALCTCSVVGVYWVVRGRVVEACGVAAKETSNLVQSEH